MDYNLLKTFAKVSELGSFTKAARALNQPKSRVSRAIARLESELGVELVRRTTRKSSLTSVGAEFYQKITPHLSNIQDELIRVSDKQDEMTGVIRVTSSDSIAQQVLVQIVSEFNSLYPKVKFEMIVTSEYVDLVEEGIDIAFRAGKLTDSTLIQKKFLPTNFVLACSQRFSQSSTLPKNIEELGECKYLSFRPFEKYFSSKAIELNPTVTTDSLLLLQQMALNGDGITLLPDFLCEKYFTSKELVRVLPSWKSRSENIHILYPPTKNQPKRVRAFIELARKIHL